MPTLRITQSSTAPGRFRAELTLTGLGQTPHVATSNFDFTMTPHEHEDLRWYLEDYLQYPHDPAPQRAARIETWLRDRGVALFDAVFPAGRPRDLWAKLRDHLSDTRIEIVATVEQATLIPWELLRDPQTDTALALQARVFTRAQPESARQPKLPEVSPDGPIRILLVICRPGAADDVPFRSVAGRLIKALTEDTRKLFQLDVLRPPTFEQLSRVLRAAKADGRPYHAVHFDGHGMYAEIVDAPTAAQWLRELAPFVLGGPRKGPHGYLLFENPAHEHNLQPVDGPSLGALLAETGVSTLVLNACRSAHAEPTSEPDVPVPQTPDSIPEQTDELDNPNARVRALGSLAQEVMDQGVAGVVAMRYNVYVVTAAQFVADLYSALTEGRTLGEAVTLGRKQLAAKPQREIAFEPRALQDWPVPVVFEAAPIRLFPEKQQDAKLTIAPAAELDATARGALDDALPRSPDVRFIGRDETLLAIDRAFDTQHVVLLHAFAGSGKTAAAAEFARWYALTGGVHGPVIYTSFEQYQPLPQVLDRIGQVFGRELEQTGVNWLALDDPARRSVALDVLRQVSVLWVWDNVEPVAGFPTGTDSAWSADEQQALVDFLRDARVSKAKFLLTSRRDERPWLGDLPVRIALPPMPMQERVALARALANKHGKRITDVHAWWPLLQFTQGNPLTITVVVSQALRDDLTTREQITAYVDKLRAGEAAFDDDNTEGRSRSLGASLSYGLENAFTDEERQRLALLHLFERFVDAQVLKVMGDTDAAWCLDEIRGVTYEEWTTLLNRAAQIGLLTSVGDGYYVIHPALPWYFRRLFQAVHHTPINRMAPNASAPLRAFVEVIAALGNYHKLEYIRGNIAILDLMRAEEMNFLRAHRLARAHCWWHCAVGTMEGLQPLYVHDHRTAAWAHLVNTIRPHIVDPVTGRAVSGRDGEWSLVAHYCVRINVDAGRLAEAERMQRNILDEMRHPVLDWAQNPLGTHEELHRLTIRQTGVAFSTLADILAERSSAECADYYQKAYDAFDRVDDKRAMSTTAFRLGNAFLSVPSLRDLEMAERWFQHSLALHDARDHVGRVQRIGQLGTLVVERFKDARTKNRPKNELVNLLNSALDFYYQALDATPPDAPHEQGVSYAKIGEILCYGGDLRRALEHYYMALNKFQSLGDHRAVATVCFNIAENLAACEQHADAIDYARAALRGFSNYGAAATSEVEKTQRLLATIQKHWDSAQREN